MHKKRWIIIFPAIVLIGVALLILLQTRKLAQWVTFAQCEARGGTAWRVDLFHPDICPDCAAYRECEDLYSDLTQECPSCYGPCQRCQEQYSWQESCPQCSSTCRDCENQYRHNFKDEEERFQLCPDCKICEDCREEMEVNRLNCPPCVECAQCREENKKYADIREVCPEITPCMECLTEIGIYPDKCPGGMGKIGNISDTAIWFQCCK